MDHRVRVVTAGDRARADCRCGHLEAPERRGDRARHLSELDAKAHLEKPRESESWTRTASGFAIGDGQTYTDCPLCSKSSGKLELLPNSFGEVTCTRGHVFDLYTEDDFVTVEPQETQVSTAPVKSSSQEPIAVIDMNTESPDCPYCSQALLFTSVDVLNVGEGPFVINCVAGHEFDTYVADFMTVYLFPHCSPGF